MLPFASLRGHTGCFCPGREITLMSVELSLIPCRSPVACPQGSRCFCRSLFCAKGILGTWQNSLAFRNFLIKDLLNGRVTLFSTFLLMGIFFSSNMVDATIPK